MTKKESTNNPGQSETGKYSARLSDQPEDGAHQSFRQQEAFFRQTLESLEDYAIFTMDLNGSISSWNSGAQNVLGYSEKEIIGQDVKILFTPEDVKKKIPQKEMEGSKKNGSHLDERYHIRKDGSRFFVSGKMFALRDEQGKLRGYTKLMRDITHRNVIKETFKQAKAYAQSVIDTATEPMLVLNENFVIGTANRSFYKIFKTTKRLTEKVSIFEIGSGEWDSPSLKKMLTDVFKHDIPLKDYEVSSTFSNMGERIFNINARKLGRFGDILEMLILSFDDVTQIKQAEQFKNAFVGMASHELRGPVTTIKGYSQLLQKYAEKNNDIFTSNLAGKINGRSDKLNEMINQLLDISRIQTGKLQLEKTMLNLNNVIEEAVLEYQNDPMNHTIVFEGTIEEGVYGDKFKIAQVLNNLIGNAIKYSPDAKTVLVSLSKDNTAKKALIAIKDVGIGISKEEQANLFQPFNRARNTRNKKIGGTGLGLYITSEIIKAHGGEIRVESEPMVGSIFEFSLPIS